jgi:O-antigen/teichoic acid export membrane protein
LLGVWLVCSRGLHTQIRIHLDTIRDLVGESSRFFLSSIALRLLSQANVFFISVILGSASAAVFSLTVRAHDTGVSLIILISGALVPSMTHLFGSGNLARFRVVIMRTLIMLAMLTAFVMTLTVVLDSGFVSLWVGESRFGGQAVSIPMAAALFISLLSGVGYDALVAEGKFRLVTRYFMISSGLQVLLLCALLWAGIWMAPLVTIVVCLVYGLSFWKHVANDIAMSVRERKSLLLEILRIVVVSGTCASLFMAFYPKAGSWSALVIEGALCGVTLLAGFLLGSWQLRGMVLEEVRATLRLFRVG